MLRQARQANVINELACATYPATCVGSVSIPPLCMLCGSGLAPKDGGK